MFENLVKNLRSKIQESYLKVSTKLGELEEACREADQAFMVGNPPPAVETSKGNQRQPAPATGKWGTTRARVVKYLRHNTATLEEVAENLGISVQQARNAIGNAKVRRHLKTTSAGDGKHGRIQIYHYDDKKEPIQRKPSRKTKRKSKAFTPNAAKGASRPLFRPRPDGSPTLTSRILRFIKGKPSTTKEIGEAMGITAPQARDLVAQTHLHRFIKRTSLDGTGRSKRYRYEFIGELPEESVAPATEIPKQTTEFEPAAPPAEPEPVLTNQQAELDPFEI